MKVLIVEDSNGCIFKPLDSLTGEIDTSWMFQQDPIQIKNLVILHPKPVHQM